MVEIVKFLSCGCDAVPGKVDHRRVDICFKLVRSLVFLDILADVLEREFVSWLEFSKILPILLNGVVC